jgi:hypothetical protein
MELATPRLGSPVEAQRPVCPFGCTLSQVVVRRRDVQHTLDILNSPGDDTFSDRLLG